MRTLLWGHVDAVLYKEAGAVMISLALSLVHKDDKHLLFSAVLACDESITFVLDE